jgi:hypothetical protein
MSSPPDWYAPGHVPVPRPPPSDDRPVVWTLRKDTRCIEAVWRLDAGYVGAEATLRLNGELLRSQCFAIPDAAHAWLAARRADLERCGWIRGRG